MGLYEFIRSKFFEEYKPNHSTEVIIFEWLNIMPQSLVLGVKAEYCRLHNKKTVFIDFKARKRL